MTVNGTWIARCATDEEFGLTSRYWTGVLQFDLDPEVLTLPLANGVVGETSAVEIHDATERRSGHVVVSASREVWDRVLEAPPPPYFNDIISAQMSGLRIGGDVETFWQYYPAIRRAVELLREVRVGGMT